MHLRRLAVNLVRAVHQDVVAAVLVEQQDDVVLERGGSERAEQVDAGVGRNVRVLEYSADEQQEPVAERPAALAFNQVLV